MLDALIIESIETIRYSKKKRPDEHTIHDILRKDRNLSEVKLADINDRLAFLIKEEKIKNKPSYLLKKFLIENLIFCAVSALNTEITARQSFILQQVVILKKISTTNIRYLPRSKFSIYHRTFRTDSSSLSRKQK